MADKADPQSTTQKRPASDNKPSSKANKKAKKESDTIPILRGRFKQRWLTKHSHLLKRSDDVTGIMVSCNVNAETRALGQVSTCLEHYITKLFPDHESTWTRFEGKLDIDQLDFDEEQDTKKDQEEDKAIEIKDRKEKKFQAVDAACGGLVFYRFRINVKPTDFVIKLMGNYNIKTK
jgi:tRNA acetyltransferase TAN1